MNSANAVLPSQQLCSISHPHTKCCAFLPLRQIQFLKNLKWYHVFSPVPQTVIICHWVFKGISHERLRLFKVLHYLSNLKYRISVLRQDFPVLFNRDSSTHFEDFRLESKTRCHKRKITEIFLKAYCKNKKKWKAKYKEFT